MKLAGWANNAVLLLLGCSLPTSAAPAWQEGSGFRSIELRPASGGRAGFTLMDANVTGVWFTNELRGDLRLTNAVALNGSGLAIGDVDGDGRPDLYLCNLQGPNRLYRNLGNWQFAEIKLEDAACADELSTGAAFADVDGDGDLDLLVNGTAAGTRLFLNDGKGNFKESHTGLSRTASATSMALADIDGDGDLDLYCTHYIDVMHLADPTTRFALAKRDDKWEVTKINGESTRLPRWKDRFEALPNGKVRELAEVDGVYRNDGRGGFTAIQNEPGLFSDEHGQPIPPFRDWGLSVMFRDLNGDGAPDLYVCNDMPSPDRVWINSGHGNFHLIDHFKLRHTSRSAMGVDFADIDRDGYDDLFVVDMLAREHQKRMTQLVRDSPDDRAAENPEEEPSYNRNTLFLGRPDGSYAEAGFIAGVAASDWSWCAIFLDVDLDGYEDILVTNGFEFDVMDQDSNDRIRAAKLTRDELKRARQLHPPFATASAAFHNRKNRTFEPAGETWGFDHHGVSYGMALGDLDNDGDLDVVVNNLNGVASLYRNNTSAGRIAVRLRGLSPNTEGIGALIRLVGGSITQSQQMICGGRYLSADQAMRVFAADPDSSKPLRLEVKWRNGQETAINDVHANRLYEIFQPKDESRPGTTGPQKSSLPPEQPHFLDVSSWLNHLHVEDPYDDWTRQALLPRRLSRLGPGLCWADLNGDGWEDLTITAARDGRLVTCLNQAGTNFSKIEAPASAPMDQGAVLAWPDRQGNRNLLAAVSDYALGPGQQSLLNIYAPSNLVARSQTAGDTVLGPLVAADFDNDGDLDLFVGGRVRPGRYPEAVSSSIWLNEQGLLQRSASLSQPFASLGMVSGAVSSDLDGDGRPDLALAMDWGPVRVFHNAGGRFEEVTTKVGLSEAQGWWTSISTGDFDGDGRLDLVAGNWGANSSYALYQPTRLRLYYADWNGDGNLETIEAWQSNDRWLPIRNRLWLGRGMPELPQQFPTHEAFSKATVQDVMGARYDQAGFVAANDLQSCVFLNRGSRFERVPLPFEAQLTPVFAVNVGDFDGDGIEDLILSQNFFGSASDLTRDDAGCALWLRGRGDGHFTPVSTVASGIRVYGEQRAAALADFNHDGRMDVAITQNNGPTRLYLNQHGKKGLRVVLHGPAANPDAIGAQLRVLYAQGRSGPVRAIQAGSGYWSQDAATQILGLAEPPTALWLRWPGGREQTVAIRPNSLELPVSFQPQP